MLRQRPFLVEILTAIGLIAAPFVLPHLGFTPTTINRIMVWGLFGIGFDILFGFTGLLSFGQSAFFGTGGMVAAYLLTVANFPYVLLVARSRHDRGGRHRVSGRPDRTQAHRHLLRDDHRGDRGSLLFRRVQSAVGLYRRRERAAGRSDAEPSSRLHDDQVQHRLVAVLVPRVLALRRHRDRVAYRTFARRGRAARHPRQSAACHGRGSQYPRLQTDGLRRCGCLCRLRRGASRHHAGLHAAGRLHVRYVRATGDADRDRRCRHAVRAAGRRGGVAFSQRPPADPAASRRDLEAGSRRDFRAADLLPAPRADRRH